MPREYPEWDISDADREALANSVSGSTWAGLPSPPVDAAGVRTLQDRYGKDTLIAHLAGTTDKGSRQWKSARDGLSRRRAGRMAIGRGWRDKFISAGRRARARSIIARGQMHVTLTADILTSRHWDRGRRMNASLSGDDLQDYLDAVMGGRHEEAAMVVADSYGIGADVIISIANVSGVEADIPRGDDDGEDEG